MSTGGSQSQPGQSKAPSSSDPAAPDPKSGAQKQAEEKQAEEKASGGGGGSAIDKEVELAKQAAEDHEEAQVAINEASARASAAHRESYEGSDQQAVHEQIKEAEAAMRGPNIEIGVPGDPTKGPSS